MLRTRMLAVIALAFAMAGPTVFAATNLWWDVAYLFRFNVDVTAGANAPDKGYSGYTARVPVLDTQTLITNGEMLADCSDLRVLYYDGLAWQELPRHVLGCNTATTDIRFMLSADIPASTSDDNYYIYYGSPAPAALPAMSETNVYIWYDDASIDRSASYVRGRVDNWHGSGWDNSLVWNPAGYYTYNTGDNFTSGYRRAIDERDVYIEAEAYITGCFNVNNTSGVLARGIINNGTLGGESSNHYYASNRGHYPGCSGPGGYSHDGDIIERSRTITSVDGPNPPAITPNQWRRQGLAAWLTSPTNLSFWDEDNSANWAALGYPDGGNLQVTGTDAVNESTGRGFAAVMTAQETARLRNIVMRRYIDPEPVAALTFELQPPALLLQKTLLTAYDPVNLAVNPKAIPGSWVDYTITAQNSGAGSVDADTMEVTDPVPNNASLFVGDLGAPGSGPVEFTDGTGSASSGLTYNFGGLADMTDDVDFSVDGVDWTYEPTPDVDGFDPAVQFIRVRPGGSFAGSTGTPTQFDLRLRVLVQ